MPPPLGVRSMVFATLALELVPPPIAGEESALAWVEREWQVAKRQKKGVA